MSSFCKGSLRGNHTGHKAKGQVTMSVFESQSLLNAFPPLSKGSVYFRVKMAPDSALGKGPRRYTADVSITLK